MPNPLFDLETFSAQRDYLIEYLSNAEVISSKTNEPGTVRLWSEELSDGKYKYIDAQKTDVPENYVHCSIKNVYLPPDKIKTIRIKSRGMWKDEIYPANTVTFVCSYSQREYLLTSKIELYDENLISAEYVDGNVFFKCNECGKYYPQSMRDEAHSSTCVNCTELWISDPARWCKGVHAYNADVFDILNLEPPQTTKLLMGIELEQVYASRTRTEFRNTVKHSLSSLPENYAIYKQDGSVHNGAELVTVPCDYKTHLNVFKDHYKVMKKHLGVFGNGTGMHVHINRSALTQLEQGKLLYFCNAHENRDFIMAIAGRLNTEYANFQEVKITSIRHARLRNKYVVLNMSKETTLEFRMFAGPKTYQQFAYRLEFVASVCEYIKNSPLNKLDYESYLNWLRDRYWDSAQAKNRKPKYNYLMQFITISGF